MLHISAAVPENIAHAKPKANGCCSREVTCQVVSQKEGKAGGRSEIRHSPFVNKSCNSESRFLLSPRYCPPLRWRLLTNEDCWHHEAVRLLGARCGVEGIIILQPAQNGVNIRQKFPGLPPHHSVISPRRSIGTNLSTRRKRTSRLKSPAVEMCHPTTG
jgi:hypothetical protein